MQTKQITLVLLLILSGFFNTHAQVTIGSGYYPKKGTLLDLKEKENTNGGANSTRGLTLPRVNLTSNKNLYPMFKPNQENKGYEDYNKTEQDQLHIGLLLVNVGAEIETNRNERLCKGLHVWNGGNWVPLSPYPIWDNERVLYSDRQIDFEFLDHNDGNSWPEGKVPTDYPLGEVKTFVDNRDPSNPQTYHYTRFYVGISKRERTYKVKQKFACDPNNTDDYEEGYAIEEFYDAFEDGLWMTENLRATINDPIRNDKDETMIQLSSAPSYTSKENTDAIAWGYPDKKVQNVARQGIIYTWSAATNGSKAVDNEAGLAQEGSPRQGICPAGWSLPSDREWTDLENGIILYTSKFSSMSDIGRKLAYDTNNGNSIEEVARGSHSLAMTSKQKVGTPSPQGKSFSYTDGGFDLLMTGEGDKGGTQSVGYNGYGWSSSSSGDSNRVWNRRFNYRTTGVFRRAEMRGKMMTVRCKKVSLERVQQNH